jgi:hypothetical protein
MKQVTFKNKFNGEKVICDDTRNGVKFIDGIEYYVVHRNENPRTFLMRKDSLEKVPNKQ